uniref:Uncharacterized protein n=1 Tax=Oryza sativa subsp. japonica TaxID=39947 RepID=Q5N750_ORYSJ|nr:hypothetical protein [Oryza sativa Japonica Group]BAD82706.1 hypothetical protein [Oryza sativa Japonica Group]
MREAAECEGGMWTAAGLASRWGTSASGSGGSLERELGNHANAVATSFLHRHHQSLRWEQGDAKRGNTYVGNAFSSEASMSPEYAPSPSIALPSDPPPAASRVACRLYHRSQLCPHGLEPFLLPPARGLFVWFA